MKCTSALSLALQTDAALTEVIDKLNRGMKGEQADLTIVFATMHHADEMSRISASLREHGLSRHVLGCTAEGVVAEDREIEGLPAPAVWSVQMLDIVLEPIRLSGNVSTALDRFRGLQDPANAVVLLLGDPFSFRVDEFLKSLNADVKGLRVMGGMASGSQVPRGNQLVLDDGSFHDGAVAMVLTGLLSVRPIVSQGCRPIGRTMVVTRSESNVIHELGRKPWLEALREMLGSLSARDQRKIQDGLHLGRVINEFQGEFQRGDFLVHNVIGADDSGAIQISDIVRVGQTVQFHVRDAETADEDLRENLLLAREDDRRKGKPAGALLFTCNGRGSRLFKDPDHDVSVIHEVFGPIPVCGLFAMGEIGPVGGQNFIHGFTASVLLFEEPA